MKDFLNEAKETLEQAKMKAAPVVEDLKEKAEETFADIKEKAAPVLEDLKGKAEEGFAQLKEKAAPVVEKVKGGVSEAVEAVKEGAEKVEDFFTPDAPGMKVKNDLFNELGEKAQEQKSASMSKAEEMQKKLEELMRGNKQG